MISHWRGSIWVFPVVFGLMVPVFAQDAQSQPAPSKITKPVDPITAQNDQAPQVSTTTRLVQLDVVVLDKQNHPVTGLTKDDFRVFDNGVEQKIAHFTVGAGAPPAAQPVTPSPLAISNRQPLSAPPPGVTAILMDERFLDTFGPGGSDLHDPKLAIRQMRMQVSKFLSTLPPGEQVGIFSQREAGVMVIRDFTDVPASLPAAANWLDGEDIPWKTVDSVGSAGAEGLGAGKQNAPSAAGAQASQLSGTPDRFLSGGGLHAVFSHMQEFRGRKNLVWISAGFPMAVSGLNVWMMANELDAGLTGIERNGSGSPQHPDPQNHFNEIQQLARALGNANVAIYPIDAFGLTVAGSSESQHAFADLVATQSGGRALFDNNGMVENLQNIVAEGDRAYQIGYYPADKVWDGSYHHIELKLTPEHSGLTLLCRKGYYAIDKPVAPADVISREASRSAPGKITVAELDQLVAAAKDKPDKAAAKQISSLSLGERISDAQFEKMNAEPPGPESRTALLALADAAEFLDLPAAEIPATPPPSIDEQRNIVVRAVQFAANNIHQMPNLLATRKTTQYRNIQYAPETWTRGAAPSNAPKPEIDIEGPFKPIGKSQVTVVYRDGHEVVQNAPKKAQTHSYGVTSRGEFGELLRSVMTDMVQSRISWSHWEDSKLDKLAVFDFDVPRGKAHYQWSYCCTVDQDGRELLVTVPASYHAEIAIDPPTGAVMRLAVKTEPESNVILKASEIVEYGPVEIGGQTYFCPMKNVVLFIARDYDAETGDFEKAGTPDFFSEVRATNTPFVAVNINHASFENYHVFRSEVRILSGDDQSSPAAEPGAGAKPTAPK
ncbi:MAG: VWA domain-containing protein [Terracidiphilus sp.]